MKPTVNGPSLLGTYELKSSKSGTLGIIKTFYFSINL